MILEEGIYQIRIKNDSYRVQVHTTMLGQYPDKREELMAHFLSGSKRFPWPVKALLDLGATFTKE
jgi:hypothetical protein